MKNMTVADAIHLNQLHNILNSGLLHSADAEMVSTDIKELEVSFDLEESEVAQ